MNAKPDEAVCDPEISDFDRDSLHILPLAIIPLKTRAIARARLVKNARLESIVELFDDVETGSGQIDIEDLPKEFGWPASPPHSDLALLRQLGALPSYDVFSLRVTLRERNISVNTIEALRLSQGKVRELTAYMSEFTRPLIREIYGADDISMQSFDDIVELFRRPDEKEARAKLKQMADRLGIGLTEIPRFLENYGDIFLSVSYYRQCLDQLMPSIQLFLDMVDKNGHDYNLRSDTLIQQTCHSMESKITELMTMASGLSEGRRICGRTSRLSASGRSNS